MAMVGAGTAAEPFLIVTPDDVREAFGNLKNTNIYELTRSIDMTDEAPLAGAYGNQYPNAGPTFKGNGHMIYGLQVDNVYGNYWLETSSIGFENIHLQFTKIDFMLFSCAVLKISNARFDFDGTGDKGLCSNWKRGYQLAVDGFLLTAAAGKIVQGFNSRENRGSVANAYMMSSETPAGTWGFTVVTDPMDAASYPGLDTAFWNNPGGVLPFLKPVLQDYSHFTHVKGTTLVDGQPESRVVRVVKSDSHGYIAQAITPADGTFDIQTTPYKDGLLVMAFDDEGTQLVADTAYALNATVHPRVSNGYRYICIQAGTTAAPLPDLPWPTGQLTSGDAIFEARKIRQPTIHGPVSPAPVIPPSP